MAETPKEIAERLVLVAQGLGDHYGPWLEVRIAVEIAAAVDAERERALAALVGVLQRDAHGEILDYEDAQAAIRGEAEKEESDGA